MKPILKIKKGLLSKKEGEFILYLSEFSLDNIDIDRDELKKELNKFLSLIKKENSSNQNIAIIEKIIKDGDKIDNEDKYDNLYDVPMNILIHYFGEDIEDEYELEKIVNYFDGIQEDLQEEQEETLSVTRQELLDYANDVYKDLGLSKSRITDFLKIDTTKGP